MSFLLAYLDFREPISAWSHCAWLLLSIPATVLLWRRSDGDAARRISLLVFGVSLGICYAGSTLFHAVRLSEDWIYRFDALDHIGIYTLIAGSYTPVAWNLLHGRLKWGTLVMAWSAAAVGSSMLLICGLFSMFWSTLFYVVMGWGALVCYMDIARSLSHRTLFPLLLGGILYTTGAVFNLLNWPDLWPGVFGPHEIFHLFVMGGSVAHFSFMLGVVAPAAAPAGAVAATARGSMEVAGLGERGSQCVSSGFERLPDPRIPKTFRSPVYLHAVPIWNRENRG